MYTLKVLEGTNECGCIIIKDNDKYKYISKPMQPEKLKQFKKDLNEFLQLHFNDYIK